MDTMYKINDNKVVYIHHYPVDGFQCEIHKWNFDTRDFDVIYDKRVIADSLWEGIGGALTEAFGWEWDTADYYLSKWGIFMPDDDE